MPDPGSSHAITLPTASSVGEDPVVAGKRVTPSLEAFLTSKYRAIAVVHGLSNSASEAFSLAKKQRPSKGGVIWVTDSDFLEHLAGSKATLLRTLLTPKTAYVMSFFSVKGKRTTGYLHWSQLGEAQLDLKYVRAAQNKKD